MCARDKAVEGLRPLAMAPEATKAPVKIPRIVQYYRLKQKHLALRGGVPARPAPQYTPDWLSVITSKSKACLELASSLYAKSGKSSLRSMLPSSRNMTNATIPLVLCTILSCLLAKEFLPDQEPRSRIWMLFYLIAFATHFGTQIWMTLVAGLVLYFNLPRHVFGQVQEVIFPFFYMFNATVSFIQIMAYINTQSQIGLGSTEMVQITVMTFTLCIELVIRLYIAQALVLVKHQKTRIEAEAGTGQEIGHHVLGELANCPHYMGILRKFRRMHSYISLATIVTVICSAYHINYLTDKLCI